GLRDFYKTWRFKKAGTDDLRAAMEKAAGGRSFERFFDRWIFSSGIPVVRFTSVVEARALRLRFEQRDEVYDIPIVVTITYADGTSEDVLVPVTERMVERVVELKRAVRGVEANKDGGALVEIGKEGWKTGSPGSSGSPGSPGSGFSGFYGFSGFGVRKMCEREGSGCTRDLRTFLNKRVISREKRLALRMHLCGAWVESGGFRISIAGSSRAWCAGRWCG